MICKGCGKNKPVKAFHDKGADVCHACMKAWKKYKKSGQWQVRPCKQCGLLRPQQLYPNGGEICMKCLKGMGAGAGIPAQPRPQQPRPMQRPPQQPRMGGGLFGGL